MKKEIEFKAKFDTSDFDKSVESMQKKLKEIYAPADMVRAQTQTAQRLQGMGMGGNLSQPSMEAYQRATQASRRELDQLIKEQASGQEKLGKLIAQRAEKIKELKDQQTQMLRGTKEELEIKEKIARVEENSARMRQMYLTRDQALNQAIDAREKMAASKSHSDYGSVPKDFSEAMNNFGNRGPMFPGLGMAGKVVGGIGAFVGAGSQIYRDMAAGPVRTEASMGSAVQGTMGRDANTVFARRSAFENMFGQERARASQQAMDKMASDRMTDKIDLGANAAMVGGGAATAVGTSFTGIGALLGLGVAGKGLYNMFSDERQRSLMLSPFSKNADNRYQSILAEQLAGDYQTSLDGQKAQNPFKTAAIADYEQNFMRDLGMQRMMGLNNEGFRGQGGFLQSGMSAGFTPEMAMEMAQSIQGAGGSTRMMRDSTFGLQAQRGMNLTNAGQVLGTLSGSIGSNEATKQATVKILAEGMKLGLDDSKFAEENRRFTQSVAEIVSRSGATTSSDFERISGGFGRFMGENTSRGIEAAKTAYEEYQSISSAVTGPRGVMRAAGFLRDSKLNQLSTIDKQAVLQLREDELNETNPLVSGLAEKLGISTEDFVGRVKGVNQGAVSRFREADQLASRLKGKGIDGRRLSDPAYMASLSKEDRADITSLIGFQTTELGNKGQKEMMSRLAGTLGSPEQFGPGIGVDAVSARIGGDSGLLEDKTVAAMAGDASTVLKNFNGMREEMGKAAESASKFTHEIREMNAALIKALEEARAGGSNSTLDVIKQFMNKNTANNQSQAGKQAK